MEIAELPLIRENMSSLIATNNNTGVEEYDDYYLFDNLAVQIVLFLLFSIVFVFCFFGNLTVLLVMALHWKMRSITKFCLGNLAFANLCVGIFCIYQNLTVYIIDSWIFGDFLCKMFHFINSLSHTASILILVVISVERYFVILHPFRCRSILTINRLRLTILGVWILSGILSSPRILYVVLIDNTRYSSTGEVIRSEVICSIGANLFASKTAEMIQFILLFLLPLIVISVIYYKVGVHLQQQSSFSHVLVACKASSSSTMRAACVVFTIDPTLPQNPNPGQRIKVDRRNDTTNPIRGRYNFLGKRIRKGKKDVNTPRLEELEGVGESNKTDLIRSSGNTSSCSGSGSFACKAKVTSTAPPNMHRHAVKLLVIIVISFTICNFPFHLRKIYQNYIYRIEWESDFDEIATPITFLLMYANCAINPIVYAFMSKSFRSCLIDVVKCNLKKPVHR